MRKQLLFCMCGAMFMCVGFVGCSVGMALHGADNPDTAVLKEGATRMDIEREFGAPDKWDSVEHRGLYSFTTGEDGSAGRAIAHGVGDVLTLGLWEVVGTPVEAVQSHENWEVDVFYTSDDQKVSRWSGPRKR